MKEIVCPKFTPPPYSLLNSHISAIRLEGDTVSLITDYGFQENAVLPRGVEGSIRISGVNYDYCRVYILNYTGVLCGSYGEYEGQKMPAHEFLRDFPDISLDVMEEGFGKNRWVLNGLITRNGKIMEFVIKIYYEGDITYVLKN